MLKTVRFGTLFLLGLGMLVIFAAGARAAIQDDFLPAVGIWHAETDGDKQVIKVDGSTWKRGQMASELAQSAIRAFGDKSPVFVKNVSAAANFPFAVYAGARNFREGSLSVRMKPLAGKSDQAGGILFDLKENGDYLVLRANALEDNLILFRYKDGRRSSLKEVGGAPAPTGSWSVLQAQIKGTKLKGYLNGKLVLEYTLDQPVSGKVGLWSKDDSVVLFEGFAVSPGGN